MDDGRHFTDYRPNCHLNNLMRANQQTNNSFQYRMFLTHNANHIMQQNRKPLSCSQWSVGHANRLKNCCVPTPAAADTYPVDDSVVAVKRLTVPGGGVPLTGGDPHFYR